MVIPVIVDTSLIINHLRKTTEEFKLLTELHDAGKIRILIPYEVIIELFVGKSSEEKAMKKAIDEILDKAELVGLTRKSAVHAGILTRKLPQVPEPVDLIIAAIALEHKAQIATHNPKHFRLIPKIKLWKPKS